MLTVQQTIAEVLVEHLRGMVGDYVCTIHTHSDKSCVYCCINAINKIVCVVYFYEELRIEDYDLDTDEITNFEYADPQLIEKSTIAVRQIIIDYERRQKLDDEN